MQQMNSRSFKFKQAHRRTDTKMWIKQKLVWEVGWRKSVHKLIKQRKETPSSTVQLPVKIRPLLRKFQVGLWPRDPPSPTGPIIECSHKNTHTQHMGSNWSRVVRRHWWRVLDGIISPAVLSHPRRSEAHLAPKKLTEVFPHYDKPPPPSCFLLQVL